MTTAKKDAEKGAPDDADQAESGEPAPLTKKEEKQRTDPDGDFDFKHEELPDNTVPPVGRK